MPPRNHADYLAARYRANAATMLWLVSLRPVDAVTVPLAIEAGMQLRNAESLKPTNAARPN